MKQHTREEIDNMPVVCCSGCGHTPAVSESGDTSPPTEPHWLHPIVEYNPMVERM